MVYNITGGGGTGAALTVTAPTGCTVTVSKDGKVKTKVAGADGVVVFKGLATGDWTLSITDGEQTAQKTVTITADYSTAITFFAATIHITYPAGSICTATDGVTTMTAPDTSGTWDCVVPNAGTWTVTLNGGLSDKIEVAEPGEYTANKWHLYNRGDECPAVTGGWGGADFGYIWAGGPDNVNHITKNSDSMIIKPILGVKVGLAGTKNKINLAGYSKITMRYSASAILGNAVLGLCTNRNVNPNDNNTMVAKVQYQTGEDRTISLDVTGFTAGTYYVIIASDATEQTTINSVYLEK